MDINNCYLGDGLYAEFDGHHIILRTEREEGTHWVALEKSVFENLLVYKETYQIFTEK